MERKEKVRGVDHIETEESQESSTVAYGESGSSFDAVAFGSTPVPKRIAAVTLSLDPQTAASTASLSLITCSIKSLSKKCAVFTL